MTEQQHNDGASLGGPEPTQLPTQERDSDFGQPAAHSTKPQPPGGQATAAPTRAPLSKAEEKSRAVWMHIGSMILGIFPILSFIVPLVIWLTTKDRSRMINDHGRSALNWSITYIIFMAFAGALTFVYIGAILLPLGLLTHLTLCTFAAVRGSQRRKFKHPVALPILRVG